jgi:hypothetical protein
VLGGAMARVPAEATAFAHRTSRHMVHVAAVYQRPEDAAEHRVWVERFAAALQDQEGDARAYVNFVGDEGQARVHDAYPGPTWRRLTRSRRATTRPTCSTATRTSHRPRLTPMARSRLPEAGLRAG